MKAEVALADFARWSGLRRRVGCQTAGRLVETELPDLVRAAPGDVRHEGESVGGVGLKAVGAAGGLAPLDRRVGNRPVRSDGMHRHAPSLVVGREEEAPA